MPRLSQHRLDASAVFAPLDEFARLALAVSGGPDSLALMLLAHEYARRSDSHHRFVVYSVDHGLRPEAASEAAFVVAEARRLGFAARALRWEGKKPATGLQQQARLARYELFSAAAARDGADVLVTAHHLGDQAETVMMRLAHGSGTEGLRGMDYMTTISGLTVVRPLLGVDPDQLRAVVDAAGLVPVVDPSNSDLDFERVRWRRIMPELAALGLDARRLGRFAERMRETETALIAMTAQAMSFVAFSTDRRSAEIDRQMLVSIPRAIAVRVMAQVLDIVGGGRKPHALAAVEALTARLLREPVRTTLHGCIVRAGRARVRILSEPGRAAAAATRRELTDT